MTFPVELAHISNHLYRRARCWWTCSVVISVGALSLTLAGLWIATPGWIGLGGLFALAAPGAIAWARELASVSLFRADKCRRLMLYADGLGHKVSAEDLAQVKAWTLHSRVKEAPFVGPYYSSTKAPGAQRLADIVAESAFFTAQLASKAAVVLWVSFGLALATAAISLYSADLTSHVTQRVILLVAKSTAVLVSFLIAGDFLLIAKKYTGLQYEARQAFARCAQLRNDTTVSVDEVRTVAEDYGVALLETPPIPRALYKFYRDELNRIYRTSHAGGD